MEKKGLLLISGGIDSPVAGYLMMKRGLKLDAVHFNNEPLTTEEAMEKSKRLTTLIAKHFNSEIDFYIIDHGINQAELMRNCLDKNRCVLCRRLMFKITEELSKRLGYDFIITGENLGQVASQTLNNMVSESYGIEIPILRPLLCFDKEEIITVAKEIGTYETSIEPGMCCNAVPKSPETRSWLLEIQNEEEKIDVKTIISRSIENMKKVRIKD